MELPARLHGLDWYMIFSTETNGFSLNQLYRRSIELDHHSPSLLIVKDVEQNVKTMKIIRKKIHIFKMIILGIWCVCSTSIND